MSNPLIRASVRLYDFLLSFYPARHRQAFGEEMSFVFSECLREAWARRGGRGVAVYWGRALVDVGKCLVIEHIDEQKARHTMKNGLLHNSFVRAALLTALFMLLPLAGALFVDGFNWGVFDFVIVGAIVFAGGLAFDLITRRTGNLAYRLGVGLAIATAAFLFVSNAAVGVIGSENNELNLMYPLLILLVVVGAVAVRFRAAGMERVMWLAVAAQALTVVVAFALGQIQNPTGGETTLAMLMVNVFFAAGWVLAALLFRWAGDRDGQLQSVQGM